MPRLRSRGRPPLPLPRPKRAPAAAERALVARQADRFSWPDRRTDCAHPRCPAPIPVADASCHALQHHGSHLCRRSDVRARGRPRHRLLLLLHRQHLLGTRQATGAASVTVQYDACGRPIQRAALTALPPARDKCCRLIGVSTPSAQQCCSGRMAGNVCAPKGDVSGGEEGEECWRMGDRGATLVIPLVYHPLLVACPAHPAADVPAQVQEGRRARLRACLCQVQQAPRLPGQDLRGGRRGRAEPAPRLLPRRQPAPPVLSSSPLDNLPSQLARLLHRSILHPCATWLPAIVSFSH